MGWKVGYFNSKEFECPCCGRENMDPSFISKLNEARKTAGLPFDINSGYRCAKCNIKVGGVSDSAHMLGLAADIKAVGSGTRMTIVKALIKAGFERIGISKTFIHVDDDPDKVTDMMWLY